MKAPKKPGLIGRVAGAVTGKVVDVVPPEVVLDHLDLDALLDRVDVNHLLGRVDVNQLLDRIDANRLMARVDVNALLSDVELEALVRRAGIPGIVAETTGQFAGGTLDTARRQLVGVDALLGRVVDRLLLRRFRPAGPAALIGADQAVIEGRRVVSGRYAGAATRAIAAAIDMGVVLGTFSLLIELARVLAQAVIGVSLTQFEGGVAGVALTLWAFLYVFLTTAVVGRTVGKALAGVRIVRSDGRPLTTPRALARVVVFPVSTSTFGLGLLLMVVQRRSRTLHDLVAGTAVVYDWGDRPADMPAPLTAYLDRHRVSAGGGR